MKYKLTIALVASLTSTAFAEFKAPLPEFKNEKQLAEWRAEKASESTSQGYGSEQTAFYTGKPYLASTGSYAFKYRSYNPEVARWTSEDPSGFPDGANSVAYQPCPTNSFDYEGLFTVTGATTPTLPTTTATYRGKTFTITAHTTTNVAAQAGASLAGVLNITSYISKDFGIEGGSVIDITMSGTPGPQQDTAYHWIQTVTTNDRGASRTFIDNSNAPNPFYDTFGNAAANYFHDDPRRLYYYLTLFSNPLTWEATLEYVSYNSTTAVTTKYG